MAGGKIFINYRRDDSRADSGRLYDRLNGRYPNRVFRDVGSLEPGVEWHEAIERVLGSSDACVVVIGKGWLKITDASGKRRLDDPRDTVRQEIVTALQHRMRVFPVLVGGATMPPEEELPAELQPLAQRNALEITEQDWDECFEKLAEALDRVLGIMPTSPPQPPRRTKPVLIGAAALVAILIIVLVVYNVTQKAPVTVIREDPGKNQIAQNAQDNRQKPQPPTQSDAGGGSTGGEAVPAAEPQPSSAGFSAPPAAHGIMTSSQLVGNWRAVVTGEGQQLLESVDLYPDSSFLVTLNDSAAAVGRWRYNASEDVVDISATNFLNNGVKFSCKFRNTGGNPAGLSGPCVDLTQMSWSVALTSAGGLSGVVDEIPNVDLSELTMAEKQAFAEVLALSPCTCGCGMSILNCLRNDRTCRVSPALAQTQLAAFMGIMRR